MQKINTLPFALPALGVPPWAEHQTHSAAIPTLAMPRQQFQYNYQGVTAGTKKLVVGTPADM